MLNWKENAKKKNIWGKSKIVALENISKRSFRKVDEIFPKKKNRDPEEGCS